MKPYRYTAEYGGEYETRHEAIGQATIQARERAQTRFDTKPTPKGYIEAISRVYAFEPHICDYCHQTFLYRDDYENHKTCPWWEYHQGERDEPPETFA
jgi:hypothetical protein